MKLRKLTTKNFKRLGSGKFEFTDGVNFIVGPNAAGKSTLLRAVSTALFGVSALPGVAGDVATWGTKSWGLELEFEHAGVTYFVARDHKTASVHKGAELVANGNKPSTGFLESLLNRSLKDFNLLTNSRQGETAYALHYGAAALQRDVERLSGADVVEKIIGAAKTLRMKLEAEVGAADDYLLDEGEIEALNLKVVEAEQQIRGVANEIEEQSKILAIPAPSPAPADPRRLRKAREKYLVYEAEMRGFIREKATLEKQIEETGRELPEDDVLLTQYKGEVSVLVASKRQWERARDEGKSLEKQIGEVVIPEGDFESALGEAQAALASHEKEEAALSGLLAEKRAEIKHLEKHVKEGICSACGTVLKGDVEEVKARLDEARRELEDAQATLDAEHATVLDCKKDVSNLRTQIAVQAERTAQKAKLERRLAELDFGAWKEPDEIALQVAERNMSAAAEALHRAEAHNKECRKLRVRLENLEAPAVVDEVTEADVTHAETAWAEYQSALSAWQVSQAAAKERLAAEEAKAAAAKDTARAAKEALAAHERTVAALAEKQAKATLASRLIDFLRDRREFYLTKVWDTVLGSASRFLQASTESWMTGVRLKDGAFLFEDNGGAWVPAVEASGAQAAFLGVALRVGLSQALDCDRSMMLLDEPTEAMREEHARRLMAGVGAARDQVIVVTHRETDQGLADNIIEIGASGVPA